MARGKYARSRKMHKRSLSVILCIALILVIAVGGTIAYIVTKTDSIQNEFETSFIDSEVIVSGNQISVKNIGDVNGFIRAAIVVYWENDRGQIRAVAPSETEYTLEIDATSWKQDQTTDFYYYEAKVAPQDQTEPLVTAITIHAPEDDGYELRVEVVAEAIQAEGMGEGIDTAQEAWNYVMGLN